MNLTNESLEDLLHEILNPINSSDNFITSLEYACIPAGKLFRPLLALSVFQDQTQKKPDSQTIKQCLSLEIHHSYTLAHDDLPSMDNDSTRRGRNAHHVQYSQWQAILAGDALLLKSIDVLVTSKHPLAMKMIQLFTKLLGEYGLIYGQYLDLSGEMKKSFKNLRKTHLLKTSRLIQASLLLGYYSSAKNLRELKFKEFIAYYKIGQELGLCFQFLDDLLEMKDELSDHEKDISAWIYYPQESFDQLSFSLKRLKNSLGNLSHSKYLHQALQSYFQKVLHELKENKEIIEKRLQKLNQGKNWLEPIMSLLN